MSLAAVTEAHPISFRDHQPWLGECQVATNSEEPNIKTQAIWGLMSLSWTDVPLSANMNMIYIYIYISIYLFLSILIYSYLFLSILIYSYLFLSILIYSYIFLYILIYLSIYPSICLSVCLSINIMMCVCMYVYQNDVYSDWPGRKSTQAAFTLDGCCLWPFRLVFHWISSRCMLLEERSSNTR